MNLHKFIYFTLTLLAISQCALGQLIIYSITNDSVIVSLSIIDQNGGPYKIRSAEIVSPTKTIVSQGQNQDGNVKLYIPTKLYKKDHDYYTLKIYHFTDKSQNAEIALKGKSICIGFCDPHIIQLRVPLIDKFEGGNSKTISSDELRNMGH